MKAVTDVFVRHPVLALVVNLALILVGVRTATNLPVQQYPRLDSASLLVNPVYVGASAETVIALPSAGGAVVNRMTCRPARTARSAIATATSRRVSQRSADAP
ncbi:MAG: efflux RND transporter permease subunit, partial [Planctomycetota bacterium]